MSRGRSRSGLPVASKPMCDPGGDVRGEVRNAHLGQDQKAGVSDHEIEVGLSCLSLPADVRVSWPQLHAGTAKPSAPRVGAGFIT